MKSVDVAHLGRNASTLVAEAASGETVIITVDGQPAAQIVALGAAAPIRRRRHSAADLPAPLPANGSLSEQVRLGRDDERY